MPISAPGIGSGLDVNSIVKQLLAVESQPLAGLDKKEAGFQAKITAYGTLKSALSSFQTAQRGLSEIAKFQTIKATPADATIYSASATSIAVPGTYSIEVVDLAQAHKLRSNGFTNVTDAVGSGTLTFQYGTYDSGGNTFTLNGAKAAQTVTIGAGQNTLSGIRDAINAANIGVTASIINDGTASPNKLLLTSKDTGAASSVKLTVADADTTHTDTSGLSQLAYDPTAGVGTGKNLTQTVAALDANLTVDGITNIKKPSNVVTDVVQGVTLNLLKKSPTPGTASSLTVARDTASVKTAVENFVKAYNDLNKTVSDLTAFNAATKKGSILQGDASALSIQRQVRGVLTNALQSSGGNFNLLSQIGVTFQKNGSLALDGAKLDAAINTNFNDIAALFAAVAKPSDSQISFVSATANTKPGLYTVDVTALATLGKAVGSGAAGLTITAGSNDTLSVTIDGVSATVTLGAATYASAAALAAEVQSKINGASALSAAGVNVAVTAGVGDVITVTSNRYGSASTVNVVGNGLANLLGTPVYTAGVDVSGTIGGLAASGSGQILTGAGNADGLKLLVNGGATGARGTVAYSEGYAKQLDKLADNLLASNGPITSRTDGLNKSVKDIAAQRDSLNRRLVDVERNLRDQFTRLDGIVSRLKSTSDFLAQQLSRLPTIR